MYLQISALKMLNVRIFLLFFATFSYCSAITQPSPCCQKGISAGKKAESGRHEHECATNKLSLTSQQKKNHSCNFMAKLCCKNTIQTRHCGVGKEMALAGIECSLLSNLQGTCCRGCKQGLAASSSECEKLSSPSSMSDRAFKACCAPRSKKKDEKKEDDTTTKVEKKKTCSDVVCDASTTSGCKETESGTQCVCKNGFKLKDDGIKCEPIPKKKEEVEDIKDKKTCNDLRCESSSTEGCELTASGPKCKCKAGYKQASDGITCEDVDECLEDDGVERCHSRYSDRYTYCMNFKGYYRCVYECPSPRYYQSATHVCKDVDECKTGRDNCDKETHTCLNRMGSFYCKRTSCKAGYKFLPNGKCQEMDQCREKPCSSGQYCLSYFGKRECIDESCPNDRYYQQTRKGDIAECSKKYCDNIRDSAEKKQCWDATIYPSSIKRYAYKYQNNIDYKTFKFNYWWNFDERKYYVQTILLGNEKQDFYLQRRINDLDVFNQRDIKGPKMYSLVVQVDVKERRHQKRIIWRFKTYLYVFVA